MIPTISHSLQATSKTTKVDLTKVEATTDAEVDYSDQMVKTVISNLKKTTESFQIASQTYNHQFFKDEPKYVRSAVCSALASFFAPTFNNSYWTEWQDK